MEGHWYMLLLRFQGIFQTETQCSQYLKKMTSNNNKNHLDAYLKKALFTLKSKKASG